MANGTPASNISTEVTLTSPVETLLLLPPSADVRSTETPNLIASYSTGRWHNNHNGDAKVNERTSPTRPLSARVLSPKRPEQIFQQQHMHIAMVETPSSSYTAPTLHNQNVTDEMTKRTQSAPLLHHNTETKAPSPQDTASYSVDDISDEDSELDPELQAQQIRARFRLAILRRRVFRTRSNLREHRERLRELRQNVREAADKLTRKVSECIALGDTAALLTVLPLHEILRSAQDAVGPEEEEYDRLERRLDDEERDLEQEEDHFDRHVDLKSLGPVEPADIPESKLDEELSPLIKPYNPSDFDVSPLNITDERFAEYLEKVAEAEELKQELDELEDDYGQLTKDITFRKRHRVPVSKETYHFINIYPQAHEETLQRLYDIEDDIENLREYCIEHNIFSPSEHIYIPRSALYEDIMDSVDEARARSPLRTAANNLDYPETEIDFSDKRAYINKWLLKWVQESAFETLLLRAYIYHEFPPESPALKDDNWSKLALESWDLDHAGERTNQGFTESRMDTILGDPRNIEAPSTAQRTGFLGILTDIGSLEINPSMGSYSSISTQPSTTKRSTAKHRPRSAPATILRARSTSQ